MIATSSGFINSIITKCNEYIEKCETSINYHKENAKNAKKWNLFINMSNIVLSATMAFSMTVMSVLNSPNATVTIVGSTFALFIGIGNKIKDDMSFKSLAFAHDSASDSYSELKQSFVLLLNDIDKHQYSPEQFDQLILKYEAISQKSHFQSVKCCKMFCCLRNG